MKITLISENDNIFDPAKQGQTKDKRWYFEIECDECDLIENGDITIILYKKGK